MGFVRHAVAIAVDEAELGIPSDPLPQRGKSKCHARKHLLHAVDLGFGAENHAHAVNLACGSAFDAHRAVEHCALGNGCGLVSDCYRYVAADDTDPSLPDRLPRRP